MFAQRSHSASGALWKRCKLDQMSLWHYCPSIISPQSTPSHHAFHSSENFVSLLPLSSSSPRSSFSRWWSSQLRPELPHLHHPLQQPDSHQSSGDFRGHQVRPGFLHQLGECEAELWELCLCDESAVFEMQTA